MFVEELVIANEIEKLDDVREWLIRFAEKHELPETPVQSLMLCGDEWITNVIWYGFPGEARPPIHIKIVLDGRELSLIVEDEGIPFNPLDCSPPVHASTLEEAKIGGLGIYFMKRQTDAMYYERTKNGNRLTMMKRLDNEGNA